MLTRRDIISVAISGLLLVAISVKPLVATEPPLLSAARAAPEACTLLTTDDASTALETKSVAGKRHVADSPTGCVWSNDPAAGDTSRRVDLDTHSLTSFQVAKRPAITTITIEPVAGIGDEAFYQVYPHGLPPFIWVRKGNNAISIRVGTRVKNAPFTLDQEKAKEAVLAKAALARLP